MTDYERTQDRIVYAQAMNLAVEYLKIVSESFTTSDARTNAVLELREFFYEELCKTPPRTLKVDTKTASTIPSTAKNSSTNKPFNWKDTPGGQSWLDNKKDVDQNFGEENGERGSSFNNERVESVSGQK